MTWTKLLAGKDVQHHRPSKKELDEMRALVARDLADAGIDGLSADRKYATAYNAALQAANMAIACARYRVTAKTGHHKIMFYSANLALGAGANKYADYFETCRRKRNMIDYTRSHVATETEAKEIVEHVLEQTKQAASRRTRAAGMDGQSHRRGCARGPRHGHAVPAGGKKR